MSKLLAQMRKNRYAADAPYSSSSNAELCVIEAELAAEGRIENYHVPTEESVVGQVQARCEQADLEPAWTVIDDLQ